MLEKWRARASAMKRDVHAVYYALQHPDVPWYAKALALLVAAYALSPIDLIPDFIPVLGYLDDVILVPAGILLVRRMIPDNVWVECQQNALAATGREGILKWAGAMIIAAIWLLALFYLIRVVGPSLPLRLRPH